jgi:SprT-like protein
MTDQELCRRVEELSLKHFDQPFRGVAKFNSRFTRLGGRCTVRRGAACIEVSLRHFERHGESFLRETILHELCHYHLFVKGIKHDHRSRAFRELLARVGASLHCAPLDQAPRQYRRKYAYRCPSCGRVFRRVKPLAKPSSCGHFDRSFNPRHKLIPVDLAQSGES